MPKKIVHYSLVLILGFLPVTPISARVPGFDRKGMEAKLREQMVGKVAVLRNFYKQDDLTFDSQGTLVGSSKAGPWTYYARIQVSSINLTNDSLVIKGDRNVVQWELSVSEFKNYTLDEKPIRITIRLDPGYVENSVASAITKIFLTRETRLSDVVPGYWKEILTTERERRADWDAQKAAAMKNVHDLNPDISAPKLLSKAEGIQISSTPFKDLLPNNLALSFVVDEEGEVKQLQIEKPVGLGLDDPIAETILRWKWEPARMSGNPVAVLMHAKILFPAEKGHIDPYHTQPCPSLPNVFQC